MKKMVASVFMLGILTVSGALAEIKLETENGSLSLTGKLLKFEDGKYTMETVVGEITVSSDLVTCSGEECPDLLELDQRIRIAASDLAASYFLPALAKEYANRVGAAITQTDGSDSPNHTVIDNEDRVLLTLETRVSSAADAFNALLNGDVDLILTERRATNDETDRFLLANMGDLSSSARETIWALDGIVAIVSPENPVQVLTLEQTEQVFSGAVSNWSAFGGPNLPITVYLPAENTDVPDYFAATVLDANFSTFSDSVDRSLNSSQIDARVSTHRGAIGLVSSSRVSASSQLTLGSSCGLESAADSFSIRSETYPLTRRLYAYTSNRDIASRMTDLVDLLQDVAGQRAAGSTGFTSLSEEITDMNSFGKQLAYSLSSDEQLFEMISLSNFAGQLQNAHRLSTTFRFSSGSSQLDNKSRIDLVRLTRFLQQPKYAGAEIVLAGFSDSIGRSTLNKVLSRRRAGQVKNAILAVEGVNLAPESITAVGYGVAFPVACNNSPLGRQINRRVDVWIR